MPLPCRVPGVEKHPRTDSPRDQGAQGRSEPSWNLVPSLTGSTQGQTETLKHHPYQRSSGCHQRRQQVNRPVRCSDSKDFQCWIFFGEKVHREGTDDGSEQHTSQKSTVQILNNFLEHKGDGCQRRIESSRQTGSGSRCSRMAPVLLGFSQYSGQIGGNTTCQLNTGAFTSHTRPPTNAQNASHKLDPGHSPGDLTKITPKGNFELGNPTP